MPPAARPRVPPPASRRRHYTSPHSPSLSFPILWPHGGHVFNVSLNEVVALQRLHENFVLETLWGSPLFSISEQLIP